MTQKLTCCLELEFDGNDDLVAVSYPDVVGQPWYKYKILSRDRFFYVKHSVDLILKELRESKLVAIKRDAFTEYEKGKLYEYCDDCGIITDRYVDDFSSAIDLIKSGDYSRIVHDEYGDGGLSDLFFTAIEGNPIRRAIPVSHYHTSMFISSKKDFDRLLNKARNNKKVIEINIVDNRDYEYDEFDSFGFLYLPGPIEWKQMCKSHLKNFYDNNEDICEDNIYIPNCIYKLSDIVWKKVMGNIKDKFERQSNC